MYSSYNIPQETLPLLNFLGAMFQLIGVLILISSIIALISQWKIYKKAGKNGWECLVPIYNIIVLLQIVELPLWYLILLCVPIANIYVMFKIYIELAHKFGKSTGFGVLTVFFNFICLPILAFSKTCVYNVNNNNSINNNNQLNNQNIIKDNSDMNQQQIQPEPITFNQNIDTEIKPINSLGFEPIAPINNNFQLENNINENIQNNQQTIINSLNQVQGTQNDNVNNLQQPANNNFMINTTNTQLNVIPGIQNAQIENPQPVQSEQVINQSIMNSNQSIQEQSVTFNPQPQNVTPTQGLNVIPGMQNTPTVENNTINNIVNTEMPLQPTTNLGTNNSQSELNVIPGMSNPVQEQPSVIQPQQVTGPNLMNNTPNSGQVTFNGQPPVEQPVQGLNVIPTMGPTPQPVNTNQNIGNNQNM